MPPELRGGGSTTALVSSAAAAPARSAVLASRRVMLATLMCKFRSHRRWMRRCLNASRLPCAQNGPPDHRLENRQLVGVLRQWCRACERCARGLSSSLLLHRFAQEYCFRRLRSGGTGAQHLERSRLSDRARSDPDQASPRRRQSASRTSGTHSFIESTQTATTLMQMPLLVAHSGRNQFSVTTMGADEIFQSPYPTAARVATTGPMLEFTPYGSEFRGSLVSLQPPTTYAATEAAIFGAFMTTLKPLVAAWVIALPAAAPAGAQTTPPSYSASTGIEGLAPSCDHPTTD